MRFPRELYQIEEQITQQLVTLRPAQAPGLALWIYGTVLAKSACLSAILVELVVFLKRDAARQRLRKWLKDGRDKARPCDAQVDLTQCFPALLRWVINWWQNSPTLPLAIDAVSHQDRVVVLVVSVLYRGCAIPVAWHIVPAQGKGAWMPHILALIHLAPAVPRAWRTRVLVDRGLWSPDLWRHLRQRHLYRHGHVMTWPTIPVSIRLADAWPFQRSTWRSSTPWRRSFQSALRMRGLFNAH